MTKASQKHRRKYHEKDRGRNGSSRLFSTATKSALISLLLAILLAALLSLILLKTADPISLITPTALAVLYLASFSSGFVCMKRVRESYLACGTLSGAILMLTFLLVSLLLPDSLSSPRPFALSLFLHSLIIIFSILGSYTAKNGLSKRRKRRR